MPDLLSIVVFLPAVGCLLIALFPAEEHTHHKALAFAISLINFAISLALLDGFDANAPGFQFAKDAAWIEPFGIRYHIGIDGISLFLILLTTFLVPLTILGAWRAINKEGVRTSTREGGTMIEYEDEDPQIRRDFEDAIDKVNVPMEMPEFVYATL